MNNFQAYMLQPRLLRSFPCIHKTCEMNSNPSMSTCTSHHIPHTLGMAWWFVGPDSFSTGPISWEVCGLDGGHPCICIAFQAYKIIPIHQQDMRKRVLTHPWPLIHHITTDTSLWMVWWFANPAKYWPVAWEVCGLDGGHRSIWITSHACGVFLMYS